VALEQTVSADQQNRGWVLIKETGVLITSFWFGDCVSVHRSEQDGLTQIAMHGTLWYATTATVTEVHGAIAAASALFHSSTARKRA
jgi:hypothetical protein